jgi:hypothetical protein
MTLYFTQTLTLDFDSVMALSSDPIFDPKLIPLLGSLYGPQYPYPDFNPLSSPYI